MVVPHVQVVTELWGRERSARRARQRTGELFPGRLMVPTKCTVHRGRAIDRACRSGLRTDPIDEGPRRLDDECPVVSDDIGEPTGTVPLAVTETASHESAGVVGSHHDDDPVLVERVVKTER